MYPPIGLLYIGAVLEQHGHEIQIVDLGAEKVSEEQIKKYLLTADAVGMSVYTNNYQSVADTARVIKKLDPEIPLIIGGPHCSFLKERALYDIPDADIEVELEGELVMPDLVEFLKGEKQLSEIPGIIFREGNQIKYGKNTEVLKDLDALPFPARHLVEKYDYGNFPWGYQPRKKFTSMLTSRGCPFHCRFCSKYNNINKNYGYRERSAQNVFEEIREINDKYGSVKIVDDNFLVNKKRAHKIFDLILENRISIDILILGARVDSADKELYKKMRKANVKFLSFGVESGSQPVLDCYNKKITKEQIRNAVKLSRKMNFTTVGSFIFGAPIETKEHIEETIKFVCSLPFDSVIFRPLKYEVGSELWNEALKQNKVSKDEYAVPADSRRDLGNFTYEELQEYSEKATSRFYLRPQYLLGQIYRALSSGDINRLKNMIQVAFSHLWKNIF
ncbi:MAG: radical SAM protein [Euryarchaeota archaeon]|nr:radical SAM protein [Euryarchaeota archaeon]